MWPAARVLGIDGWSVRLSGNYTKRANSASPLAPRGDFGATLRAVEAVYAAHGQPAIFRLTPLAPPGTDAALEAAGYRRADPSRVLTVALGPEAAAWADPRVGIEPEPSANWLAGAAVANGVPDSQRAAHDALIELIPAPKAFATLVVDGAPAGFGLAVVDRGIVGLFALVIDPAHRGRGLGRILTRALLGWGRRAGAGTGYLQVFEGNGPALALYASLRFEEAHGYHYRVQGA